MRNSALLAFTGAWIALSSGQALAQSTQSTAPAISRDDPEYRTEPLYVGPFAISAGMDAGVTYDSNIYATPNNEVSDGIFELTPYALARYSTGPVTFDLSTQTVIRRYFDRTTENSEGVRFAGDLTWKPSEAQTLRVGASWERAIEDRGDPEARAATLVGPRQIDILTGTASFRHAPGRILLAAEGVVAKYNARAAVDADRDYSSYAGSGTVGYRVSGAMFATATGFVNRRDFRLSRTIDGLERNSTTFGGRLGLEISPGGLIEGSLGAGIFRHDPDDATLSGRTGFSLAGSMIYRPSRRTAFTLDLSNGDVATFRGGATSRTDTTARVTAQQEIRHNLFASAHLGYRKTKFVGLGMKEDTVFGGGEVEFLASRNLSFVANASYGTRDADLPTDEFDRFRGSVGLRLRF